MNVILGSAYWPNLHYLYYLVNANEIYIDLGEHYVKQSYRNRTSILTANGVLNLNVPIKKTKDHTPFHLVEISYAEDWRKQHFRTLNSAYRNSPFYDFLEDEIAAFYNSEYIYLHELNTAQLHWIMKVFRLTNIPIYSKEYIEKTDNSLTDLRTAIHPKTEKIDAKVLQKLQTPYYQTFESTLGFNPNLSVLDLIFNEGIKSYQCLII